MKNLFRSLVHAVYGLCFFLMLPLPYHRYECARETEVAGVLREDTGEGALVINLFLLIYILTQGVPSVIKGSQSFEIQQGICGSPSKAEFQTGVGFTMKGKQLKNSEAFTFMKRQ
jgi:hypothetical protein